jgi:acyl-CoA hydrolase
VHIGDLLVLKATVNDVGTTSMECGVRVEAHDPVTGTVRHANTAYLVFVAVDDDGNPRPVPPLVAETEVEQRRQREAKLRRTARLAHKEAVKAARAAEDAAVDRA